MILQAVRELMLQLEHENRFMARGNNAAMLVSVSRQSMLCKAQA